MDLNTAFITASQLALVPIVIGLIEIIKGVKLAGTDGRFAALYSLGLGVGGAFLLPSPTVQFTILAGIVIGLSASGVYSQVKKAIAG